jgi:hypothetical protein
MPQYGCVRVGEFSAVGVGDFLVAITKEIPGTSSTCPDLAEMSF